MRNEQLQQRVELGGEVKSALRTLRPTSAEALRPMTVKTSAAGDQEEQLTPRSSGKMFRKTSFIRQPPRGQTPTSPRPESPPGMPSGRGE